MPRWSGYGYCVVVVSEGVRDPDGKFLAEAGTKDAFGHSQLGGVGPVVAQMTQEAFGYKFHWAVADYLQRSARHIASKVDVDQAYAVGKAAVELALKGRNAVMPIIVRKSAKPYRWSIGEAPLRVIANKEKKVPRNFITADGFGITVSLPYVFVAADRRRGLPALSKWLARLRHAQRCQRCQTLAQTVCGIVAALFLAIKL